MFLRDNKANFMSKIFIHNNQIRGAAFLRDHKTIFNLNRILDPGSDLAIYSGPNFIRLVLHT